MKVVRPRAVSYPAMLRRLFTMLSVMSLLLCVAAVVLWVRSYRVHQRLGYSARDARYTLHLDGGRLRLTRPPPSDPAGEARLESDCRELRNQHLDWRDDPDTTP